MALEQRRRVFSRTHATSVCRRRANSSIESKSSGLKPADGAVSEVVRNVRTDDIGHVQIKSAFLRLTWRPKLASAHPESSEYSQLFFVS